MTAIAVGAARDMGGMFARRSNAIVTGAAFTQHLTVVHCESRRPNIRIVAILADVSGLYMRETLASRLNSVVAADAVARNIQVVEISR